jgi:hypothetical protein
MIVRVEGLNLLPGATELLDQCVDDLDEDGRLPFELSWQDILQSLWKLSQDKGATDGAGACRSAVDAHLHGGCYT